MECTLGFKGRAPGTGSFGSSPTADSRPTAGSVLVNAVRGDEHPAGAGSQKSQHRGGVSRNRISGASRPARICGPGYGQLTWTVISGVIPQERLGPYPKNAVSGRLRTANSVVEVPFLRASACQPQSGRGEYYDYGGRKNDP